MVGKLKAALKITRGDTLMQKVSSLFAAFFFSLYGKGLFLSLKL